MPATVIGAATGESSTDDSGAMSSGPAPDDGKTTVTAIRVSPEHRLATTRYHLICGDVVSLHSPRCQQRTEISAPFTRRSPWHGAIQPCTLFSAQCTSQLNRVAGGQGSVRWAHARVRIPPICSVSDERAFPAFGTRNTWHTSKTHAVRCWLTRLSPYPDLLRVRH